MKQLGGFTEHRYGEDYDLWLRALASGATHIATPKRLYLYHRSIEGQKSENLRAGRHSKILALIDLLDSGLLTAEQERRITADTADYFANWITKEQEDAELSLLVGEQQRLERSIAKLLGPRAVDPVMRAVRKVSWIVAPMRQRRARRLGSRTVATGSPEASAAKHDEAPPCAP
jgi:hypothetical protein